MLLDVGGSSDTKIGQIIGHEIGHTIGLKDITSGAAAIDNIYSIIVHDMTSPYHYDYITTFDSINIKKMY